MPPHAQPAACSAPGLMAHTTRPVPGMSQARAKHFSSRVTSFGLLHGLNQLRRRAQAELLLAKAQQALLRRCRSAACCKRKRGPPWPAEHKPADPRQPDACSPLARMAAQPAPAHASASDPGRRARPAAGPPPAGFEARGGAPMQPIHLDAPAPLPPLPPPL